MEKMGNRIQIPEIAAAVVAAFFVGRINLFDGTFPAAVAFMIVMLTASTLYIYLLPVLCGAMMLYIRQGIFVYGDLLAVIVSALFFLFLLVFFIFKCYIICIDNKEGNDIWKRKKLF